MVLNRIDNRVSFSVIKLFLIKAYYEKKNCPFRISNNRYRPVPKGPGKRGHIVADTLLPTQMFPRLLARATFVPDTNFVSGTQKMFLILFRNILYPQQMFHSLRSSRKIMGNNVSTFTRALKIAEKLNRSSVLIRSA